MLGSTTLPINAYKTKTPQRWALGRVFFSLFVSKGVERLRTLPA